LSDPLYFLSQSERCRRLARQCADLAVATQLESLAREFERKARELDPPQPPLRDEPGQ
jgi:hypothetical protein